VNSGAEAKRIFPPTATAVTFLALKKACLPSMLCEQMRAGTTTKLKPMNKTFAVVAAINGIIAAQADVVELDVELSGANMRPDPVVTGATGGEYAPLPSMSFDTSSHQLFVNYAWGSVNGFSDITGSFLSTHIHGPADRNGFQEVLYSLTTLVNPVTPGSAGIFGQTLQLVALRSGAYSVSQQEADLLKGLWYVDVHSSVFSNGEMRGQLVRPAAAAVPEPATSAIVAGMGVLAFALYRRFNT
jgi:hypothetical protein